MATLVQMSQERMGGSGGGASSPPAAARVVGRYPAASLSEVASAALANVGSTGSEASSSSSLSDGSERRQGLAVARQIVAPASSNGSRRSWGTDDTSPTEAQRLHELAGGRVQRPCTPEMRGPGLQLGGGPETSPVSPPFKQGAKRTASGAVKEAPTNGFPLGDVPRTGVVGGHVRAKSMSRAAEISSTLKTRLAYAMVKVNHGWENQSLDQLEHISRVASPSLASPSTTSPRRRRFSLHSDSTDRYITSPNAQFSPSQFSPGFPPQSYTRYSPPIIGNTAPAFQSSSSSIPSLAPAAPIAPGRSHTHRRSQSTRVPPSLTTRGLDGQVETPRRQGILRMPSQQAEKDALDSLLFMASPNNSSNLKYTDSPAGPSPLRTEFPGAVKRVVFER